MEALVRAFDWSKTPLGPVEDWSSTLWATVRLVLANGFPMLLWWGPEFIQIYNDAYIPVLGTKHPHTALGKPFRECWSEVFDVLGPLAQTPFEGGPPTWMEDIPLEVNRYGFLEEAHFTIAYSPVPDETAPNGIGGVLASVHEIGDRIVGERRVLALRELGTRPVEAKTAEEAAAAAAATLGHYNRDIPWAMIYLLDADGRSAHLAGKTPMENCEALCPIMLSLDEDSEGAWPLKACDETESIILVADLQERFPIVPRGPWPDPPHSAALVPIRSNISQQLAGFLIAGLSPRLRFDDSYRGFLDLASAQIAIAIANARAYEEECRRAEALAEIDRAKTTFFTNISHEFRTPLTLMLGPLEETISRAEGDGGLSSSERIQDKEQLGLVHRNAMRLLKLVNALLDFSRIEAGRATALYQPTDLGNFTAELASVFRSTTEKAGLELKIECAPLRGPVDVDREMWEKIVLNLISNAFKFTFAGSITIRLRDDIDRDMVHLEVADTGIGIAQEELPRLFERFHRVENARGRSFEGTGIGLALVQELVKLHGGTLSVESELRRGTTFTASLPIHHEGRSTGAAEAVSSMAAAGLVAQNYAEEALRWLPNAQPSPAMETVALQRHESPTATNWTRAKVLIADDNSDMREYLRRLLSEHYDVQVVANGAQALAMATAAPPDLVVTDVMMPELDGFGLLRALRANSATSNVAVLMLSARAGEGAQIEGLEAGADDYMIKPFSAGELLARVQSQLKLRQRSAQFKTLVDQAPLGIYELDSDFRILNTNPIARAVFGDIPSLIGSDFDAIIHTLWTKDYADEIVARFRHTLTTGEPYSTPRRTEYRIDRQQEENYEWRVDRIPLPEGGYGLVCYFRDISVEVKAEAALVKSEKLAAAGRLAATLAHEINNPLQAVANLMDLLRRSPRIGVEDRAYVDMAADELHRVTHLTRQSLSFYRETSSPVAIEMEDMLKSILDLYAKQIEARKIAVTTRYESGGARIESYPGAIRQVLSTLLVNAMEAVQDGGTIAIRVRRSCDSRDSENPGVQVTILDNGVGIAPADTSRIFEPFFTTKGERGTGLGLWVAQGIINGLGGTIGVRSSVDPGKSGTCFSLFLPNRAPQQISEPGCRPGPEFGGGHPIQ